MIDFKKLLFEEYLLSPSGIKLNCNLYKIYGKDVISFLQGQLSSDVKQLAEGMFQFTARLDRSGRIVFAGLLIRNSNSELLLAIPAVYSRSAKEELQKYIVADDVSIDDLGTKDCLFFNEQLNGIGYTGRISNIPFYLYLEMIPSLKLRTQDKLLALLGFDLLESLEGKFLNESTLVEIAYSKSKGCFLGKEAIAKLTSNRSAPNYPVLLGETIQEKLVLKVKRLPRASRELQKFYDDDSKTELDLYNYPLPGLESYEHLKNYFLSEVVNLILAKDKVAEKIFERFYSLNKDCPEIIESYASFLMNSNHLDLAYDKALELSFKFPNLPMGHALQSIVLMRQGKIEQAEEAKAKSVSLSFGANEGQNLLNNQPAKEDAKRRRELFKQVLELDPEDSMAIYGMLDTSCELGYEDYADWLLKVSTLPSINKNKLNLVLPKLKKYVGMARLNNVLEELIKADGPHKKVLSDLKAEHLF